MKDAPAAFPWAQVMTAGFGLMHLSSDAFWSMTPREIAFAMRPVLQNSSEIVDRAGLNDLIERFPDTQSGQL